MRILDELLDELLKENFPGEDVKKVQGAIDNELVKFGEMLIKNWANNFRKQVLKLKLQKPDEIKICDLIEDMVEDPEFQVSLKERDK